jgi:tetratricopeptide (TPR) repeat protein
MIINLPRQLTPSELLCCVELSPFIDDLLQRSRALRRRSVFEEAESCARDALRGGREPGGNISIGAARMHLADVYREMGRLGPALADCQKAYRIFQNQPSQYQRHNEAMAAYALGLIQQLLGSYMDALNWYEEAGHLLERAKEHWETLNCACIHSWLGTLSEYLTNARTRVGTSGDCLCVSILLSNADTCDFAIAELEIDQYIIREREAEGGLFGVRPIKGNKAISLKPDAACSTQKIIDGELLESLGAREEDYALIAWEDIDDKTDPGILRALSGSEEYGPFVRDTDGNIRFVRPAPIVIGEEEADGSLQIGDVIALLSPTPSSSEPSAPPPPGPSAAPRPGPSTPPPEPSADAAALTSTLISMVGGDKETAESLIEYERERNPDASQADLIDRAIVRLIRDRR